jgi:hypothetical protein
VIRRMSPSGPFATGLNQQQVRPLCPDSDQTPHRSENDAMCPLSDIGPFIGALERLNLVAPQSIRHQQVTSPSEWNYFFSPVPVPVVVAAPVVVPVPVAVPVRRS